MRAARPRHRAARLKARLFFNSPVTPALAAELAAAGHGRLQPLVSIDGPEAIHDALRCPGNHAAVLASIANLLAVGLEPVANTVLLRPALPGLPALARELKRAGVARLHLILPHQRGGLPENPDLVPSGAEMLAGLRELLAVAARDRPDGRQPGRLAPPARVSPRTSARPAAATSAIDPYGRVHACTITAGDPAFVAGDLRREALGRHLAVVAGPAAAARRAGPRPGRVRRLPGRRRLRRRVLDAGPLRGPGARLAGRPRRAVPYCDLVRPVFAELLAERAEGGGAAPSRPAAARVAGACGGQAAAGADDYALFDCI